MFSQRILVDQDTGFQKLPGQFLVNEIHTLTKTISATAGKTKSISAFLKIHALYVGIAWNAER